MRSQKTIYCRVHFFCWAQEEYIKSLVPGDCSAVPSLKESPFCRFVHPFLGDDVDAEDPRQVLLIDGNAWAGQRTRQMLAMAFAALLALVGLVWLAAVAITRVMWGELSSAGVSVSGNTASKKED